MRHLYLLRHAHAEDDHNKDDLKRNLSKEGIKEAEAVADLLIKIHIKPALIITSHANRAYQTAQVIAETIKYPVKSIQLEQEVYNADEEGLLDLIQRQDEMYSCILLVGHNPQISQLLYKLTNSMDSLPTAGIALIESPTNSWDNFSKADIVQLDLIKATDPNKDKPEGV